MPTILSAQSPISSQKNLVLTIRERWQAAKGEVLKIKIDDLDFFLVDHKKNGSCDLTMRSNDTRATSIQSFFFNTNAAAESDALAEGVFHVHRMGKRVFGKKKKPLLFGIVEMHGIDLQTGQGGDFYAAHRHDKGNAKFSILSGAGAILVGTEWRRYRAGSAFPIPAGTVHAFVTDATAGKSAFFLTEERPIACCKHDGTRDSDFVLVPTPPMPSWVQTIHTNNLAAIQAKL